MWKDFPARLANATGMGVFAYSRFGYGRSAPIALPRPLSYMHDEAQTVLQEVLDAIGFRDGGSIAAIYAGSTADERLKVWF